MIKVHPSAVVSNDAQLAEGVTIGPNCVIDSSVSIGA
jgi:acyl-[acyl carrier protein]--UDP-N-acetylglucosamine O-acyltransferase